MTRLRPRAALGAVALLACMGLLLGGCGTGGNPSSSSPPTAESQASTWVLVVDLSKSTLPYRGEFVRSLGVILDNVRPGDRLAVVSVESTAVKDSRYLYEAEVPSFSFSPSPRPETDNDLVNDAFDAGEQQRYDRELAAWQKAHSPEDLKNEVLAAVERPIRETVSSPSDLFGGLYLAGGILSSAPGKKRVVMLSDGLVNYAGVNWQHKTVTKADVKAALEKQNADGDKPDLHGSPVFMIGVSADSAKKFAALRSAWMRYLEAVGGKLGEQDFLRQLETFRLEDWLKD